MLTSIVETLFKDLALISLYGNLGIRWKKKKNCNTPSGCICKKIFKKEIVLVLMFF